MKKFLIFLSVVTILLGITTTPEAIIIGGVEFPDGAVSFVDEVVSYSPTSGVDSDHDDPTNALGVPDYSGESPINYVSLGDEGIIVLKFTDNSLTTSGDSDLDLWVFEIGPAIEPTDVFVSTNGINWIYVGATSGATSGIDIDAYIGSGIILGELYTYVGLEDLLPNQSGPPFTGADIDAVGAISSAPPEGFGLDIKPGSCPNPINPKSKGVLPVAIVGTENFDVNDIDPDTIQLEGVDPNHLAYADVATPFYPSEECECTESSGDGITDLVLNFSTPDIVAAALDAVEPGDELSLVLTATLFDGTVIEISDCVVVVGGKK